jgi:hypothetical protein
VPTESKKASRVMPEINSFYFVNGHLSVRLVQ